MHLNLLVIRSKNPTKLANLYKKFGLHFNYHQHGKGPFHYSCEQNGLVFEIYPFLPNQVSADASIRLGFNIKNLEQTIANLPKKDIIILKEPAESEWGYHAVIKDFENRKIELLEDFSL